MPEDKENATVFITQEESSRKLEELLNTDTYKIPQKDTSSTQETEIGCVLMDYIKKNETSDELYNWLRPSVVKHPAPIGSLISTRMESHFSLYPCTLTSLTGLSIVFPKSYSS